jgi:hypothetical protein
MSIDDNMEDDDFDVVSDYNSWAPVTDFQELPDLRNYFCPGFDIFVSSPGSKSISHLRQGIKASVFLNGPTVEGVTRLFSVLSDNTEGPKRNYMLMSYPWKSVAYLIIEDEDTGLPQLMETPDDCGICVDAETLVFSFVRGTYNLVQAMSNKVILTDANGQNKSFSCTSIVKASLFDDLLALITSKEDGLKLVLFRLQNVTDLENIDEDWIVEIMEPITLEGQVSFVKLVPFPNNQVYCFVGTHKPSIMIYKVSSTDGYFFVHEIKTIFTSFETEKEYVKDSDIPHDMLSYDESGEKHFLIGMRSGNQFTCVWDGNKNDFIALKSLKLGNMPIEYSTTIPQDDMVFLLNNRLLALKVSNMLDLPARVIVEAETEQEIVALCPFYPSTELLASDSGSRDDVFLAAIVNRSLKLVRLQRQPTVIVHKINLASYPPKRLVYMDHVSVFAVLLDQRNSTSGDMNLTFVDPKTYEEAPIIVREDKKQSTNGTDSPGRRQGKIFSENEIIRSMCGEYGVCQMVNFLLTYIYRMAPGIGRQELQVFNCGYRILRAFWSKKY